jgi:hypothetical protein
VHDTMQEASGPSTPECQHAFEQVLHIEGNTLFNGTAMTTMDDGLRCRNHNSKAEELNRSRAKRTDDSSSDPEAQPASELVRSEVINT